ncbi:hypothetical protein [Nostoc sp. TCL240-02]|nr:hypothetical protein [Nostoc sp. TCL240-02]
MKGDWELGIGNWAWGIGNGELGKLGCATCGQGFKPLPFFVKTIKR